MTGALLAFASELPVQTGNLWLLNGDFINILVLAVSLLLLSLSHDRKPAATPLLPGENSLTLLWFWPRLVVLASGIFCRTGWSSGSAASVANYRGGLVVGVGVISLSALAFTDVSALWLVVVTTTVLLVWRRIPPSTRQHQLATGVVFARHTGTGLSAVFSLSLVTTCQNTEHTVFTGDALAGGGL